MKHILTIICALSMLTASPALAMDNHRSQQVSRGGLGIGRVIRAHTVFGHASWYGPGFHGRRTANGERFNQWAMTAAHKSLPFGTLVRVTNTRNQRTCVVRINDRGPFIPGRSLDLSAGAARTVGISGVGTVRMDILAR